MTSLGRDIPTNRAELCCEPRQSGSQFSIMLLSMLQFPLAKGALAEQRSLPGRTFHGTSALALSALLAPTETRNTVRLSRTLFTFLRTSPPVNQQKWPCALPWLSRPCALRSLAPPSSPLRL